MSTIPRIDPSVRHMTIGQLRRLPTDDLKTHTVVAYDGEEPVAVVLPYGIFLEMQCAVEGARVEGAPPPPASLPQSGPSTARGFDPSLGQRVPGAPWPASDSPLRGV